MPSSGKINGVIAAEYLERENQSGPEELGSTYTRRKFNPATGNERADQNNALLKQERDALDQHRREQEQQEQASEQAALEKEARTRLLRRTGQTPDDDAIEAEVTAMKAEDDGDKLGTSHGDRYLPDDLR